MAARKIEFEHNTDEQVEAFVRKTLALIEEVDPPGDLRPAVFAGALGLYSARLIQFEQTGPMMAIPRNHG